MIVEFRVLAVSKEMRNYDTDYLKGLFDCDHPIIDTVDNLPIQATITVLTNCDWTPVTKPKETDSYLCIGFVKKIN